MRAEGRDDVGARVLEQAADGRERQSARSHGDDLREPPRIPVAVDTVVRIRPRGMEEAFVLVMPQGTGAHSRELRELADGVASGFPVESFLHSSHLLRP